VLVYMISRANETLIAHTRDNRLRVAFMRECKIALRVAFMRECKIATSSI
jgi:hypothetical protein